jgi:hypothetical protein
VDASLTEGLSPYLPARKTWPFFPVSWKAAVTADMMAGLPIVATIEFDLLGMAVLLG